MFEQRQSKSETAYSAGISNYKKEGNMVRYVLEKDYSGSV